MFSFRSYQHEELLFPFPSLHGACKITACARVKLKTHVQLEIRVNNNVISGTLLFIFKFVVYPSLIG